MVINVTFAQMDMMRSVFSTFVYSLKGANVDYFVSFRVTDPVLFHFTEPVTESQFTALFTPSFKVEDIRS